MKIRLYTGGFTHTLHREQVHAMPAGVEVVGSPDLHAAGMKADIAGSARLVYRALSRVKQWGLGSMVRAGIPNVRRPSPQGCDLIHSAQYLLVNRTPWVVDFEDASVFAWYDPANLAHPRVRRTIGRLLSGPACRAVLPWSEAARDSLLNAVDCEPFRDKIRVIYPVIRPSIARDTPTHGPLRLLFVGTAFYFKGGLETLLAVKRVRQRVPVELTMISFVPDDIRRQFDGVPGIRFKSRIPPEELEGAYRHSDVLVAPFHTDTFGFVVLEAFARGLPAIVTHQFALPEIVTDGVTGIVIPNSGSRFGPDRLPRYSLHRDGMAPLLEELRRPRPDYIDRLAGAIERLARDPDRRQAMGRAGYQEVVSGRFSIAARQRALAAIYGVSAPSSDQRTVAGAR